MALQLFVYKNGSPQAGVRAQAYDYDPADPTNPVLLGTSANSVNITGNPDEEDVLLSIPLTVTDIPQNHRLMIRVQGFANHASQD